VYPSTTRPESVQFTQNGTPRLAAEFGQLSAVSCGIWQTASRNFANFATENCGLMMSIPTDACSQVYEWRVQKMEAFRLEQELAADARLDAEHARMVQEEKEKMHREQQKAKVVFSLHDTMYLLYTVFILLP